jgi:mono/diheme cytochrome c family protein
MGWKTLSYPLVWGVLFLVLLAVTVPRQASAGDPSGSETFASYCIFCHRNGGNTIDPNLPLEGAPELGSYYSFKSLVRQGRGQMPSFSSSRISESQLRKLYRYVSSAYGG